MPRQTPSHRVNTKAYFDTPRPQLLGNFCHRILRLGHRHTVARGDDHRLRVFQHLRCLFRANLAMFAHFFIAAAGRPIGAEAASNHADKGAVHRLTHNVREDGTGRTHQRAGDDQQVIAQHKARCRCRPARVGVEHGNHHRHIRAADRSHQVPAEGQRDRGHHQQAQALGTSAVGANKNHHQREGDHQRRQVQLMAIGQHQRLRGNFAAQFTKRHHRTGEGDCTDEDAEEHFGQMDIDQNLLHPGFMLQVAVKTHQHRRQAHEAVQDSHQLRHLGHLDLFRQTNTDRPADHHREDDPTDVAGVRPQNRGDQGDSHPGDAEIVALLRRFVFRQTRQAENKQDCGNNVCSCN